MQQYILIQRKKMDLKEKTYVELLQLRSDLFDKGIGIIETQNAKNAEFKKAKEEHTKQTEARMHESEAVQAAEKEVAEAIKAHPDNPKNKPPEVRIETSEAINKPV